MLTAVQLNLCNLLSFGTKFIAITSSKMSPANTTLGYGCFSTSTSKAKTNKSAVHVLRGNSSFSPSYGSQKADVWHKSQGIQLNTYNKPHVCVLKCLSASWTFLHFLRNVLRCQPKCKAASVTNEPPFFVCLYCRSINPTQYLNITSKTTLLIINNQKIWSLLRVNSSLI